MAAEAAAVTAPMTAPVVPADVSPQAPIEPTPGAGPCAASPIKTTGITVPDAAKQDMANKRLHAWKAFQASLKTQVQKGCRLLMSEYVLLNDPKVDRTEDKEFYDTLRRRFDFYKTLLGVEVSKEKGSDNDSTASDDVVCREEIVGESVVVKCTKAEHLSGAVLEEALKKVRAEIPESEIPFPEMIRLVPSIVAVEHMQGMKGARNDEELQQYKDYWVDQESLHTEFTKACRESILL